MTKVIDLPIYNTPLLDIDIAETRRYAGLRKSEFPQAAIEEACIEARILAQPKGTWDIYPYDHATQTVLSDKPFTIAGAKIGKHLSGCTQVIILAATVGDAIEEAVTEYFSKGKYAYSTILDAAATAAVEQVADSMEKYIQSQIVKKGLAMRWRFSPGYGDWPIEQQPDMLRLSNAKSIGMSLTDSMMLTPRKSITAIIGLYNQETVTAKCDHMNDNNLRAQVHSCNQCDKKDCLARKIN